MHTVKLKSVHIEGHDNNSSGGKKEKKIHVGVFFGWAGFVGAHTHTQAVSAVSSTTAVRKRAQSSCVLRSVLPFLSTGLAHSCTPLWPTERSSVWTSYQCELKHAGLYTGVLALRAESGHVCVCVVENAQFSNRLGSLCRWTTGGKVLVWIAGWMWWPRNTVFVFFCTIWNMSQKCRKKQKQKQMCPKR